MSNKEHHSDEHNQHLEKLDVAVIGGGVSGVYSAWRLQNAYGAAQKIALFEYSNRIGGRLYSRKLPGLPNVVAELGGMRYIPDDHIMVKTLVNELGLQTKEFPMGSDLPLNPNEEGSPTAHADNNIFYLRGQYFRYRDFAEHPDKIPYKLAWSEQGYGPENLQVKVMNLICPGFADMSLCEQMQVKVMGKEIWKYGFWNLLYQVLTNEGYQFMKDAGGYDANVANANAVTQLPATEYSDDTEFLTLKDGFQSLPLTLAEQFTLAGGIYPSSDRVSMNQRLAQIKYNKSDSDEYRYTLVFHKTHTNSAGKTTDSACGTVTKIKTKKIILAMPRRSLELIKSEFFEDKFLKENLKSVLIQKAFKMFMAYEQPWWRSLGLVAGRSVTDLPIRQTYYMGTECEQDGGEPTMNSLLMASYNDIETIPFWKGLEKGTAFVGFQPNRTECKYEDKEIVPQHEFQITQEMVDAAQLQISVLHNQKGLPKPYSAVYQEWSDNPYGGGWHEWKAGYRIDKIMCQMRHPVADQDIYIVGEAYSYEQGWVEGALNTAESMLEEFFELKIPNWLTSDKKYKTWLKANHNYNFLPVSCPGCTCTAENNPNTCKNCKPVLDEVTKFAYEGINNVEQ
ncbi:MAG: monoamine oxidase [Paraglaciecola sp.]|jgi:monoamine oxidase